MDIDIQSLTPGAGCSEALPDTHCLHFDRNPGLHTVRVEMFTTGHTDFKRVFYTAVQAEKTIFLEHAYFLLVLIFKSEYKYFW